MQFQLTQGKVNSLPAQHGSVSDSIKLDLFGNVLNVLPTTETPIEIGVASHVCPECRDWSATPIATPCDCGITDCKTWEYPHKIVYPELVGDTWLTYPCHQFVCDSCDGVHRTDKQCEKCDYCETCCEHVSCESCGEKHDYWNICSKCGYCTGVHYACCICEQYSDDDDYDSDADRYCDDCVTPGWKFRGWDTNMSVSTKERMKLAGCEDICPPEAMATFYLLDYVAARSVSDDPLSLTLKREALVQQSQLVERCDKAFREYLFLAIGGELRHHSHVSLYSSDRSKASGYWMALGDKYSRVTLLDDAIELFRDRSYHAWPSESYGGELWATAADILKLRESGRLDAKSFVDRVFSLQHNSGSILDKISWGRSRYYWGHPRYENNERMKSIILSDFHGWDWYADDCKYVGEAHAAIVPDMRLLLRLADEKACEIYRAAHVARNKANRFRGERPEPMPEPYAPADGRKVKYEYVDRLAMKEFGERRAA